MAPAAGVALARGLRGAGAMDMQRKALIGAGGVVLLAGFVVAFTYWNYEFIYYGITLAVIGAGVMWVDRRSQLPLPVLWGLFLWLVLHLAGGIVPVPEAWIDEGMTNKTLYNVRPVAWLPRYDQCVHAFGFFVSSLAAWRAIYVGSGRTLKPTFGPRVGAGLMGMGLGGMNEVIEFIGTRIMPETNVGDFVNTGWDLVSNMTGCVIAMLTIRVFHRRWFAYQ